MMSPNKILTLFTLVTALTISDFPLIQNPKSKILNSQVLAQNIDERKAEGDRLNEQGIQQFETNQFEAALQSWQQARVICQEIKERQCEGAMLANLGNAYSSLGNYTKAIDYYQQRLVITRELKDGLGERNTIGYLGEAYQALGDYAKAIDYYQQLLAIAKNIRNRKGEEISLGNLGNAYQSLGDYAKAIDYFQQSLAIARELNDRKGEEASLGNLGNAYYYLGDYAKMIEYQQQSLAITREINNRLGESASLGSLGEAYRSLGDYAKAIEYQQQSLAIAQELKNREVEGAALNNLGNAYQSQGDYAKTIDYQQQSLFIARELKDRLGEGASLGNLGNAYQALGDHTKAIDYFQQSLFIARELKYRLGEGASLGNLGNAYQSLGDYPKAIEYFQQGLAIARDIKNRQGEGASLGNLGLTYYFLGDYAKAIDYQQQRLAIAREIKDRLGEGQSLGNLGNAYRSLGNYAKAIEYFQQSLAIKQEIKDRQGEGSSLNDLGVALFESGNLTEAEKTLRTGIKTWESQRARLGNNDAYKISIFEFQARTYRLLQQVLIAQNKTNDALEISEQGRARAFVELLTARLSPIETQSQKVAPPTLEQIKQIAKIQNSTLVQYSIIYDEFKVQGKKQTKESKLYIWVIKPTGEVNFRNVDLTPLWQQQDTSLDELVTISRESIGVRSRGLGVVAKVDEATQTNRLQQLHQILIQPIADLLPTNPEARVIFMPQSSLFLVPFPALRDDLGKYLIEKHTILTAPSIQVLELTRKQWENLPPLTKGGTGGVNLIVGNPTMPSVPPNPGEKPQQLASLPGAEAEAKAIAPLLNTQPLIGNQATESVVKQLLPKARIIHLATHGLLDDIRGIGSAIALTPDSSTPPTPLGKGGGGENNGLLTAEEILDLKLNAELVVLSACDTGRGRITGDGVVGLSRSLISAGVSSVIVSLWSVPDAPTASLMTEFYNNIQQHKLDKAQALRQAMLTTMKTHPNPRNWAAFTLIGQAE